MNPDIKERWLKALRSDNYQQTTGYLQVTENSNYNDPGFCCLGVLCDIAVQDGVVTRTMPEGNKPSGVYEFKGATDGFPEEGSLPMSVMEWAGLDKSNPTVEMPYDESDEFDTHTTTLADLNDDERLTFHEIADIIERQL